AEDGIRDLTVTGVQTCALPISLEALRVGLVAFALHWHSLTAVFAALIVADALAGSANFLAARRFFDRATGRSLVQPAGLASKDRSEERRVGKECRWRGWGNQYK